MLTKPWSTNLHRHRRHLLRPPTWAYRTTIRRYISQGHKMVWKKCTTCLGKNKAQSYSAAVKTCFYSMYVVCLMCLLHHHMSLQHYLCNPGRRKKKKVLGHIILGHAQGSLAAGHPNTLGQRRNAGGGGLKSRENGWFKAMMSHDAWNSRLTDWWFHVCFICQNWRNMVLFTFWFFIPVTKMKKKKCLKPPMMQYQPVDFPCLWLFMQYVWLRSTLMNPKKLGMRTSQLHNPKLCDGHLMDSSPRNYGPNYPNNTATINDGVAKTVASCSPSEQVQLQQKKFSEAIFQDYPDYPTDFNSCHNFLLWRPQDFPGPPRDLHQLPAKVSQSSHGLQVHWIGTV